MPKIKSAKTGKYTTDSDKDTTFVEATRKKPDVEKAVASFWKKRVL